MRVGVFQFAPEFGNINANLFRVEDTLASVDADLMVLPELFNSGYVFESKEEVAQLSEEIPAGLTTERLIRLASQRKMVIVAGMPEYDPAQKKYYNSSVVVGPEGYIGKYRKTHLFYKENLWFSHGDLGFQVFTLSSGVQIGVMICFDWFFPEAARSLALQGTQILCHPSNLVLPYCQQAMITRSLENSIISVTANRVGREQRDNEDLLFTGQSQVVDTKGQIKFRLGDQEERVAVVEVNPVLSLEKTLNQHNHLFNDRRPEFYRVLDK
jgi:predicted amidohydrolase